MKSKQDKTANVLNRLRSSRGLTMVELLIAGVAMGLVSIAALSVYRSQHSQYLQQNEVVDMQQNLRAVMDEVTGQVRQAGYLAEGLIPAQVVGTNKDMLIVRYHDGDSIRAQIFFLLPDTTGQSNLMTQLNGEPAQLFAEGIDSVKFTTGGAGGGVGWVKVDLVAKSASVGFKDNASSTSKPHLYRRLSSTIKLRNNDDLY